MCPTGGTKSVQAFSSFKHGAKEGPVYHRGWPQASRFSTKNFGSGISSPLGLPQAVLPLPIHTSLTPDQNSKA